MLSRTAATVAAVFLALAATPAFSASLPVVESSASNQVPACTTPGRLFAFLKARNPRLDPRYEEIGVHYMRHGEELGLRWDYAFWQMVVETNSLRYTGDVDARQNNFAGIGATGGGVKGESFSSVSDGVRAHLEHIAMYAGKYISNPVADRTRKVQSWGIMDDYRRRLPGPMTFTDLGRKWAPSDRGYSNDLQTIANVFNARFCNAPDPKPQLLAGLRGSTGKSAAAATAEAQTRTASQNIAVLTPKANKLREEAPPNALGAGSLLGLSNTARAAQENAAKQPTVLNADTGGNVNSGANANANASASAANATKTAMAAGAAKAADLASAKGKCKVWTASYGGAKAIIIKAVGDGITNYTVLDVHAGKEQREAQAYINAYAKGGTTIGEFANPTAALDKAFQLCPEKN